METWSELTEPNTAGTAGVFPEDVVNGISFKICLNLEALKG